MRDVTDNRTGELEMGEVKRGRGRPRKAGALTNAQRQAAYRARQRQSVTVTKNALAPRLVVPQVDAYDECQIELEALREEVRALRRWKGQVVDFGSQLERLREQLALDDHGTSADGAISLRPVYCLGACACSPALELDGQLHARITPERLRSLVNGCLEDEAC